MRRLLRWLGFKAEINNLIAFSISSLELRLNRLTESQDALRAEVRELKALIDQVIRRNNVWPR